MEQIRLAVQHFAQLLLRRPLIGDPIYVQLRFSLRICLKTGHIVYLYVFAKAPELPVQRVLEHLISQTSGKLYHYHVSPHFCVVIHSTPEPRYRLLPSSFFPAIFSGMTTCSSHRTLL